jgi:WD40 repeat protein
MSGECVLLSHDKHLPEFATSHWHTSVVFTPDGRRVVSGTLNDSLHIWSAETGRRLAFETPEFGGEFGEIIGVRRR